MSGFYRFPSMANIGDLTTEGQAAKIFEEAYEAKSAQAFWCYGNGSGDEDADRIAYGMELMDVIHAAETALRMGFSDEQVDSLRELVIEKNATRGYYDAEYQWKDSEMTIGDSIEGKAQ